MIPAPGALRKRNHEAMTLPPAPADVTFLKSLNPSYDSFNSSAHGRAQDRYFCTVSAPLLNPVISAVSHPTRLFLLSLLLLLLKVPSPGSCFLKNC